MKFTNWISWGEREIIENINFPGVYLLAHFKETPKEYTTSVKNIVYIGETCSQTLKKRLSQFHKCALEGKPDGHSGGVTYYNTVSKSDDGALYLSVCPISIDSYPLQTATIKYLERKLILEYVQIHNEFPACNKR